MLIAVQVIIGDNPNKWREAPDGSRGGPTAEPGAGGLFLQSPPPRNIGMRARRAAARHQINIINLPSPTLTTTWHSLLFTQRHLRNLRNISREEGILTSSFNLRHHHPLTHHDEYTRYVDCLEISKEPFYLCVEIWQICWNTSGWEPGKSLCIINIQMYFRQQILFIACKHT